MPPHTVNVCRPSKWGNPHREGFCPECGKEHTRAETVKAFRLSLTPERRAKIREALAGFDLACFCALGESCHADVLLEIANGTE
jgi:hypothetical protein